MPDPAPPAASSGVSPTPFITGGGGFAVGLLSMFGIKDLLPTQHALALTMFGLVTCLVLVIAIATMDMKTVKRKDGSTFAIGEWATGGLAFVMLMTGLVGAGMFAREYYLHNVAAAKPTDAIAYYSYNPPSSENGDAPVLMVNGLPNGLWRMDHKPFSSIQVPANAIIEVRVPTGLQQQAAIGATSNWAVQGAPGAP